MTILIYCLFFTLLLPYLSKAPVAAAMTKLGGYDNTNPREQQAKLEGAGARALAAHQNAFESLIIYTMATAVVLATNNTSITVQVLAVVYLVARVVYCVMYYLNLDKMRSLMWLIGLLCPLIMIANSLP